MKNDDIIVAIPAIISIPTNPIRGLIFSIFHPKKPLERAEVTTIIAELIPEALPAKLGTA